MDPMEKYANWWCEVFTFSECAGLSSEEQTILALLFAAVALTGMALAISLMAFMAEIRHSRP